MEEVKENLETPEWLKKIQARSWEAELLVSGGALFSIIQLSDSLIDTFDKTSLLNPFLATSISFVFVAVKLLSFYFALHLCVRGFWLGLIFLQKLYPTGINSEKLKLQKPYYNYALKFNLIKRINLLDKLGSFLFSWSTSVTVLWIGLSICFFLTSSINYITYKFFPELFRARQQLFLITPILLSFFLFLIDFFLYGIVRQSKYLAKIYLPIYIFWNSLSLGFIWRPNLQLIFYNVKKRWLVSLIIAGTTLIVLFTSGGSKDFLQLLDARKYETAKTTIVDLSYFDKQAAGTWLDPSIQSNVITEDYVKAFMPYNQYFDRFLDSLKQDKKYLSDIFKIAIDDSTYTKLDWVGIEMNNGQKGIITVIDITNLPKVVHQLEFIRNNQKKADRITIPFWKQ